MASNASDPTVMYQGSHYDVMMSNPAKRLPSKRSAFKNEDDRKRTAETRKIGSCVRCRMQRIRVRTPLGTLDLRSERTGS